jgi:uncharacterized protein (TIGR02145 family)
MKHIKSGFKNLTVIILISIVVLYGCDKTESENKAPICTITNPDNGDEIQQEINVTISVDADGTDGYITEVRFYIDDFGVGSSRTFPYNYEWNTAGLETGNHIVKATAHDNEGGSTKDEITVSVIENKRPVAAFSCDQTEIYKGQNVKFTDQSTQSPTIWSWVFGDGNTSIEQNPSHSYSSVGTYTVSLSVSNAYGSDTKTKIDFITVDHYYGTVTDYDGNTYKTIEIGNQWWMAENLKTTHYANGTAIDHVEEELQRDSSKQYNWDTLQYNNDKAYCYYSDSSSIRDTYGPLYNWPAAMNGVSSSSANPSGVQGVCPVGWHLPSHAEWTELIDFLGGSNVAGDKMKETGTTHWNYPTTLYATNSSGFTALPGGERSPDGDPASRLGTYATFWSSTVKDGEYVWFLAIGSGSRVGTGASRKNAGFSVRCVND